MTQELFNNILASLGAITGISGLVISLFLLVKERLKFLVIHPVNESASSFMGFNGIDVGQNDFGDEISLYTPYLLFAWLQIVNKSKTNTTILKMSIRINDSESVLYNRTSDNFSVAASYKQDEYDNIFVESSYGYKHINLPIEISSFSSVEGYFFFRDLNVEKSESYKAILKIYTPQGIRNHKLVVKPQFPELIK
ncbi:hypothetical protein [Anaerocolumna xylanovorans]|uniref:Uncharacterized protein n=1 Tax=Anaerocolumna xylanovorans DSM 12503 TaxID=1121345 RepID=A0A1M7Y3P9_9FIRM|nr:hypothetical protein [Anaerocolumna xylanovorans]SHO46787.1 hypothetical protein SAMN02745217_01288 [Anaerocolumna xylanovorans DSM 12503]